MSSYTKWDRAAYIDRVGGEEEAERRRQALMARQSGYRLAEERKRRGLTQAQLAEIIRVTPGRVSQIERGEVSTLDAWPTRRHSNCVTCWTSSSAPSHGRVPCTVRGCVHAQTTVAVVQATVAVVADGTRLTGTDRPGAMLRGYHCDR